MANDETQYLPVTEICDNRAQTLIWTTEDKLVVNLNRYLTAVEQSKSWVAPLGIEIAIGITLITADFKDKGFDAATWRAIFIVSAVVCGAWLLKAAWRGFHAMSVDDLVESIKSSSKSS